MRKIVFFIPAIMFAAFYGIMQILGLAFSVSPIVYVWIALFAVGGFLLSKGKFWGGLIGVLPGFYLIYMSTKDAGQFMDIELPMGIIVIMFYLLCLCFVFKKKNDMQANRKSETSLS